MNTEVIGYKGFDKNLKCKDFQYEIGESYEIEEKLHICNTGFHYCEKLIDIFRYKPSNCRICKVRAYGDIDVDDTKSCTNKIEILEELNISKEDRIKYAYVSCYNLSDDELEELLNKEFILDDYINDEEPYVREAVARQGYGLDRFINDKDWCVRIAVAEQGYGLDTLINDKDWFVREAVAKQGYGLDILIDDKDWFVRRAVVEQGYRLDKLVNDEFWGVREAVAKQGYGLDILVNDSDPDVRKAVVEQGYGLDILVNDPDPDVREAVVYQGYGLDILINDSNECVRIAALNYIRDNNPDVYSQFINLVKATV